MCDHEALLIQDSDGKIRADEQGPFPEIAEAQKPRSDSESAQKQDPHFQTVQKLVSESERSRSQLSSNQEIPKTLSAHKGAERQVHHSTKGAA